MRMTNGNRKSGRSKEEGRRCSGEERAEESARAEIVPASYGLDERSLQPDAISVTGTYWCIPQAGGRQIRGRAGGASGLCRFQYTEYKGWRWSGSSFGHAR